MNKLLREFKEPTDIVISGRNYKGTPSTVLITDDYHDFIVKDGDEEDHMESDGGFYIFTQEEYNKVKDIEEDSYDGEENNLIVIKDFKGNLELSLVGYDKSICDTTDFDLEDHIMYQTPDDFDWMYVYVILNRE